MRKFLWIISVFVFEWSISVLYSDGASACYVLMWQQCVIFYGAAMCYILMEHQRVIFKRSSSVLCSYGE